MNQSKDMMETAYHALAGKKGVDIQVIDISKVSVMTDYFVITHGTSSSQVDALVDSVKEQMERAGYAIRQQEGGRKGSWILLDYGDVIVHVFDKESRPFYSLERIWSDGEKVQVQ